MLSKNRVIQQTKLAIIRESDEMYQKDVVNVRVRSNSNMKGMADKTAGSANSIKDEICAKTFEEIISKCGNNPFYRSKIVCFVNSFKNKENSVLKSK